MFFFLISLAPDESEAVDRLFDSEPHHLTVESAEEETEDSIMSPVAVGSASPQPGNEGFTPKEGSPYEVPVYIPDDIPIPADLELRESSVPEAGLGIWAKVKIRMGERFGPYNGLQSATVKDSTYGWEIATTAVPEELHSITGSEREREGEREVLIEQDSRLVTVGQTQSAICRVLDHEWNALIVLMLLVTVKHQHAAFL
ncbi:hypothetical protein DNTS_004405 [Danionella cerebrum]|uniref:Uncharacterized protein n=1 Tax=Danionella cerebrum TaxID=2873325 RepID=A0A553NHB3_9TELE|nr:hypothetical protein DNTS_004405 [Danionella translucida]